MIIHPQKSIFLLTCLSLLAIHCGEEKTKPASQNPSPMIENTRTHDRIDQQKFPGLSFEIHQVLPKQVRVYMPENSLEAAKSDILIHFHGAHYLVQYTADKFNGDLICVSVNLGAGSSVYNNPFVDASTFDRLLNSIIDGIFNHLGRKIEIDHVIVSSFSAGYGAIRRILSHTDNYQRIDAVLLLDGIHADYFPDRQVLSEGGIIDSTDIKEFLNFAQDGASENSAKRFLITHSEIFPGTYASTTEATDYILNKLQMKRQPVLKWGPLGMQQLSIAKSNQFAVFGFAGNTAPDHIDHLHGLYYFFNEMMNEEF